MPHVGKSILSSNSEFTLLTQKYAKKLSKKYQKDSIRVAKQLGYGKNIITKIMNAQSDSEIGNILHDARLAQA